MRNQTTTYIKNELFNSLQSDINDAKAGWTCQYLMNRINNQLHTIHQHDFDLSREFEELVLQAKRELIKYRNQHHWDTDEVLTYTSLTLRFIVELLPTPKKEVYAYELTSEHINEFINTKSIDKLTYKPSPTAKTILTAIKTQNGIRSKSVLNELYRLSSSCHSTVHNGYKGTSIYHFDFLGYKVKSTPLMSF